MIFIVRQETAEGGSDFYLISAPDRDTLQDLPWPGTVEIFTDIEPVLIWQYGGKAQLTAP